MAAASQSFVLDGGDLTLSETSNAGSNCAFTINGSDVARGGSIKFTGASSAGSDSFTVHAGFSRGSVRFFESSTADQASFVNLGASLRHERGGATQFFDNSSADSASFTLLGASAAGAGGGGLVEFFDNSTAGSADFTAFGGTVGLARGGRVAFFGNSNAGNASFTNVGPLGNATVGATDFHQNSSAANATFTVSHIGEVNFLDNSTAADGIFSASQQGLIFFYDNATAGQGTFTIFGRRQDETSQGFVQFSDQSNAGNATFVFTGGLPGDGAGGAMVITDHASAGNAVFVLEGGANGAPGGVIDFLASAGAGSARLELLGNSQIDMSALGDDGGGTTGMTAGSIEGTGDFYLGAFNLTVGSNGLSTTFSGILHNGGLFGGTGASLTKVGSCTLLLDGNNTYTGSTIIEEGVLGGIGSIKGALLVGQGETTPVILAPGSSVANPGNFTTTGSLTFDSNGNYDCELNSDLVRSDSVTAGGVAIQPGAICNLRDLGASKINPGVSFAIIVNTATGAISGNFANLLDGSTVIVGSNMFQVSYSGGAGRNNLTLTVVE